jgi:hypothetical protein
MQKVSEHRPWVGAVSENLSILSYSAQASLTASEVPVSIVEQSIKILEPRLLARTPVSCVRYTERTWLPSGTIDSMISCQEMISRLKKLTAPSM